MAIGVAELTHAVKEVENQSFRTFETYLIATVALSRLLAAADGDRRLARPALPHRRSALTMLTAGLSTSSATTGCCC